MLLEPRQQIEKLVVKRQSLTQRERRDYNEANTKNVFVQPLFEALGWDFSDINQVEAEKTIVRGRVDYVFKLNRISKFCLEVKPLREELTDDYRKQAISYAYNKGVTWAVLTNFDRLQVFNAERQTPDLNSVLALNLSCNDYITYFDDLRLLSREMVIDNALERVAERYGRLARRIPIEKRLYQHLRDSRERLFNDVYKFHKDMGITLETTDRLIQELFDRLLFIRTAEDRELAGNHPLLAALHQWQQERGKELITRLRSIFRQFAELYDSDLFPTVMDPWEQIWISSDLLAETVRGLYDVPSDFARYDFAAIDADVLGQVYEQYLGYIAQVAKEEAKKLQRSLFPEPERIELTAKREKRKAAGIYYTPKWVTDYIVRQTVGRFIEEHDHNEILNMKVLDPACGSGSFLIRAYDELLNYHAQVKGKAVAELDWMERMEVLTHNIFGVDLDQQAVEIAKLNLLLRALAERKSLPPLANNIQCGNSLISGSDEELQRCLGDNFMEKQPFNWDARFPDVIKQGGFDIVIGNPPYGDLLSSQEKSYLFGKGFTSGGRTNDVFRFFVERGLQLLKEEGYLGMILPNSYLTGAKYEGFRDFVLRRAAIVAIIDFGVTKVFEQGVFNSIIVLRKATNEETRQNNQVLLLKPTNVGDNEITSFQEQAKKQINLYSKDWTLMEPLVERIKSSPMFSSLDQFCDSKDAGINYQRTNVGWMSRSESRLRKDILYEGPRLHEGDIPYLKGTDIERYHIRGDYLFKRWLRYDYAEFVRENETVSFNESFFKAPEKIITRQTGDSIVGALDAEQWFTGRSLHSTVPKADCRLSLKYISGLLNSKLMTYIYQQMTKERGRAQAQVKLNKVRKLPIRIIDFNNLTDKNIHDELVALVKKMIKLKQELAASKKKAEDIFGNKSRQLESQINKTDQRIDQLVCQLYGLTPEEMEMVEGNA